MVKLQNRESHQTKAKPKTRERKKAGKQDEMEKKRLGRNGPEPPRYEQLENSTRHIDRAGSTTCTLLYGDLSQLWGWFGRKPSGRSLDPARADKPHHLGLEGDLRDRASCIRPRRIMLSGRPVETLVLADLCILLTRLYSDYALRHTWHGWRCCG